MSELENWIIKWFEENTDAEKNEIVKNLDENYFLKSWMDSLKFISFISDIEEKFNITFSNNEFQNRSFATINGISKIIEEKLNENF